MTKILVIEDEAVMREEILEWLRLEEYEALGAEDGMAGVEAASRYLPDLIVSDIMMPHLDGYGVLLEVHANPATVNIPFIFLTAKAAHEDIRKGMELGADDYITKPFTRVELLHAIQARLARKAVQEQDYQSKLDHLRHAIAQEHEHQILKAKLVAMFSHDFANSLTSILMTNSLLRSYGERMDESRRLAHLNRIEASTRRLLQMLDDLLIVAQIETGNLSLEPELLHARQFIQRFQEDAQAIYAENYQIELENRIHSPIVIDSRLLRLIVANLIANATKKSPRGSTVCVSLEQNETELILTVQDQATVLPEEGHFRLFEAIIRRTSAGDLSIIGLELAIVKQAVDLCGGSIHLDSKEGVGSTVVVKLPVPQDQRFTHQAPAEL
ncbi:MAG: hybrid sensor histidine kinase/response regulator [Caldilineaceae bacterium]